MCKQVIGRMHANRREQDSISFLFWVNENHSPRQPYAVFPLRAKRNKRHSNLDRPKPTHNRTQFPLACIGFWSPRPISICSLLTDLCHGLGDPWFVWGRAFSLPVFRPKQPLYVFNLERIKAPPLKDEQGENHLFCCLLISEQWNVAQFNMCSYFQMSQPWHRIFSFLLLIYELVLWWRSEKNWKIAQLVYTTVVKKEF